MDLPLEAIQSLQARYARPAGPALMSGDVPAPKTDQDAIALVQQSKAAIDAAGGIQNASPAMQTHIKAVVAALEKYGEAHSKSPTAQMLMRNLHADPALAPYL